MKKRQLLWVSAALILVLLLWPVLASLTLPPGFSGNPVDQVANHLHLYRINFFIALLISPLLVMMMGMYHEHVFGKKARFFRINGMIFLVVYAILVTVSYGSQQWVPLMITGGREAALVRWFFYGEGSMAYFLNQLGYFTWSFGAMLLFYPLWWQSGRRLYLVTITYLSALLSILAFIGLMADNFFLNSMTVYSGLLMLPMAILIILDVVKPTAASN